MKFTFIALFLSVIINLNAQPIIELKLLKSGFSNPTDIVSAGDSRLFIVEQTGKIRILDTSGNILPVPFIDLASKITTSGNEQGLLGMTFHPDYQANGHFFVNYTAAGNGATVIARYTVSADPNIANPSSEAIIMTVPQPFANHNAGDLAFGPDGYLYIPLGDGGSGGDPGDRAQDSLNLLGKLLRIDVDNGTPYSIPTDNPFVSDPKAYDEIWAIGLRNPFRISFDRLTGDLWIGDVGQNDWEEINFQSVNSSGGENYGWRCYEGNHPYNTSGCEPASTMVFPIAEYSNNQTTGCSVTGGFVYRGNKYPEMYGYYIFTDFCSGIFWSVIDSSGIWNLYSHGSLGSFFTTFGEDQNGELYVASRSGSIYRVTAKNTGINSPSGSKVILSVSPNPAREQFHFEVNIPNPSFMEYNVLDITGRNIISSGSNISTGLNKIPVDINILANGIYIYQVKIDGKYFNGKIIKN